MNQGSGRAWEAFDVGIYLSADDVITTDDTFLGFRSVDGLIAGNEHTHNTNNVQIPDVISGDYYIGAIADYQNVVEESDENNNSRSDDVITVTKVYPDLVMTVVGGPQSAGTGEYITITNTVTNQGVTTAGAFWVGLYLSTDNVITTDDTFLGSRSVNGLSAGNGSTHNTNNVQIPDVAGGNYYIGAIADYQNIVEESDENNNSRPDDDEIIISVASPDLVMTTASGPPSAGSGEYITITNAVMNQGSSMAGVFGVGLYLSTDNIITTGDTLLAYRSVNGLYPGNEHTHDTRNILIPAGTANGIYYIGAMADYTNVVQESDENNNSLAGSAILIGLTLPSVSFTASSQSSADETGMMTITAQLSAASDLDVTVPFTVNVSGTADDPDDYTLTPSPIMITAGNTSADIAITIAPDSLDEDNETVVVDMGTPVNATQGGTITHTATITDDDTTSVMITESSTTDVNETGATTDSYEVVLTSQPTGDVVVTVTSMDATTGVTVDLDSLTFTDATWNSAQTVSVSAVDDSVDEASPHTAVVTHDIDTGSTADSDYDTLAGMLGSVTVHITDNDSTWTGNGTDNLASNPDNWSGMLIPQNGDYIIFGSSSIEDCDWDIPLSIHTLNIDFSYSGTVIINSDLTISNNLIVSGGTIISTGNITIGE